MDTSEVCDRVGSSPNYVARATCNESAFNYPQPRRSCDGIEDQAQRRACEKASALQAKDSAACTAMRTSEGAEYCWNAVAQSDGISCLKIQRPSFRRDRLRRHWTKAKHARICSALTPPALAQACTARFRQGAGKPAE